VGNFGGRKVKINDISHIFRPELSPPALALLPEILVLLPENKQRDKCPPPTVIWPHFAHRVTLRRGLLAVLKVGGWLEI
jgi:hypothetical protein